MALAVRWRSSSRGPRPPVSGNRAEVGAPLRIPAPRAMTRTQFLQLMSLFPQPVRRQPSVEYIPTRRRAEPMPPPQNPA